MYPRGKDVGQAMEGERRLVGEHTRPLRPQPHCNEVLLFAGREVDDTVDPTSNPGDASETQVVVKQLRGVPRLGRIGSREVAFFGGGQLVDPFAHRRL